MSQPATPLYVIETLRPSRDAFYAWLVFIIAYFIWAYLDDGMLDERDYLILAALIVLWPAFTYQVGRLPLVQLRAFSDHVELSGTYWWFLNRDIPNDSIRSITAVTDAPFREYLIPHLLWYFNSPIGWRPWSKWRGWIPSHYVSIDDKALAIDTTRGRFLISCLYAEEAAATLRRIVGLEKAAGA